VALGKVKIALVTGDGTPAKLIQPKDPPLRQIFLWTRDGQSLVYIKNQEPVSNLWLLPLNGGEPKQITNFDSNLIFNFAISADGRLALAHGHDSSDVVLISSGN